MSPISIERRQKILELLREHKTLKIHELVEKLRVSPMTIHRDLRYLSSLGQVHKVHGGATLISNHPANEFSLVGCAMCGNPVSPRTTFIIFKTGGEQYRACCPHCGLLIFFEHRAGASALATDFLYGQVLSAQHAAYLVQSEVETCCFPSVISFAKWRDAQQFQAGFGGQVMKIEQALNFLQQAMIMDLQSSPSY